MSASLVIQLVGTKNERHKTIELPLPEGMKWPAETDTVVDFLDKGEVFLVRGLQVSARSGKAEAAATETCRRCGGANVSWSAPSPLWNAVIRGLPEGDRFGELLCMQCFAEIAEQQGVAVDWRLDAVGVAVELETTRPDGAVWNSETWLWELSGGDGERDA